MNHLQNSHLLAAAVGVTVGVITAAGICLYHKILENQQHATTNINLEAVNKKIAELQAEVDAIRSQESQRRKKKRVAGRKHAANDSTYTATDNDTDVDAFSTAGTDIADDEFYDCSDIESLPGDNDTGIPEAVNELDLLLLEIDKAYDEEFNIDIYSKLESLVNSYPNNVEVAWRYAYHCRKHCFAVQDVETKKEIIQKGLKVCEGFLSCSHANLYKWYAVLVGMNADYLPLSSRIKSGFRFLDYVTWALEIEPNDPELHHLLGRFRYEMASLSWIERKVASTLFAEPPSATFEGALSAFQRSEELHKKPVSENKLYLGKTYINLSNYEKGVEWLEKTVALPAETVNHQTILAEAEKLLKKYSSYRL